MPDIVKDPEYHVRITNVPLIVIGLFSFFFSICLIAQFWFTGFDPSLHTFCLPVCCVWIYLGCRKGFEITKIDKKTE